MKNKLAAIASGMPLTVCLIGCTPSEAKEAQDAIDAIGEVALDSQDVITEANAKYDALDEELKEQVGNYPVLESANAEFNELLKEKECLEAIAAGIEAGWKLSTSNPARFPNRGKQRRLLQGRNLMRFGSIYPRTFQTRSSALSLTITKKSLQNQIDGLSDYPAKPDLYSSRHVENGTKLSPSSLKALQDGYALPIGDDCDDYLRFDETAIIKGADGVQIDAFDYRVVRA